MQTCHGLLSVHCVCRPAGIPVVPVYEEDEPNTRRKVQRITSPEKWELKQVNIDSEKKITPKSWISLVHTWCIEFPTASCNDCYVGETSPHFFFTRPWTDVLTFWNISTMQILVVSLVQQIAKFSILRQLS